MAIVMIFLPARVCYNNQDEQFLGIELPFSFCGWLPSSWLAVYKILPPFFNGEPPTYETASGDTPRPPVAWALYLDERRLGWALSEISQQSVRHHRNSQSCPF